MKNVGTTDATGPEVVLQILSGADGTVIKTESQRLFPMSPNEETSDDFIVGPEYGNDAFRVVVDPANEVQESNENNNKSIAIYYGGFPTAAGFAK